MEVEREQDMQRVRLEGRDACREAVMQAGNRHGLHIIHYSCPEYLHSSITHIRS